MNVILRTKVNAAVCCTVLIMAMYSCQKEESPSIGEADPIAEARQVFESKNKTSRMTYTGALLSPRPPVTEPGYRLAFRFFPTAWRYRFGIRPHPVSRFHPLARRRFTKHPPQRSDIATHDQTRRQRPVYSRDAYLYSRSAMVGG